MWKPLAQSLGLSVNGGNGIDDTVNRLAYRVGLSWVAFTQLQGRKRGEVQVGGPQSENGGDRAHGGR